MNLKDGRHRNEKCFVFTEQGLYFFSRTVRQNKASRNLEGYKTDLYPGGEAYLTTDKKQKIRVADEESFRFSNASEQDKNRETQQAENGDIERLYE